MRRFIVLCVFTTALSTCARPARVGVPASSLSGEIRNAATGVILNNVSVVLGDSVRVGTVDADGRFRMDSLYGGTYRVRFHADGFQELILTSVALSDSEALSVSVDLVPDWLAIHKELNVNPDLLSRDISFGMQGRRLSFSRQPHPTAEANSVMTDAVSLPNYGGGGLLGIGSIGSLYDGSLENMMGAGGGSRGGGAGYGWSYRMFYNEWLAMQLAAMKFSQHTVGGFITSRREPVSTFNLDVSTASYPVVRRIIAEYRTLPQPAAVRVEELVQYFNVKDTTFFDPSFLIRTAAMPSPISDSAMLVRIAVQSRAIRAGERKPLRLTLLLDASGSMLSDRKRSLVLTSLRKIIPQLTAADRISLVTFGTGARVVVEPTADFGRVLTAIDTVPPENWTDLGAGLTAAYGLAEKNFDPRAVNHVMLWTDGVANKGETVTEGLLAVIDKARARGITLMACGVGIDDYNDEALENLARRGDGRQYYIDRVEEAERQFVQGYLNSTQIVARDVRVQTVWDTAAVASYRLVGFEKSVTGKQAFTQAGPEGGELGADHETIVLYELKLKKPASGPVGRVTVRYRLSGMDSARTSEAPVLLDAPASARSASAFDFISAVALYGELLRKNPLARNRSIEQVIELLRKTDTPFRTSCPDYLEFARLVYLSEPMLRKPVM